MNYNHPISADDDYSALSIGSPSPEITFPAKSGAQKLLSGLRGRNAVLSFAPGGWDAVREERCGNFNNILAHVSSPRIVLTETDNEFDCELKSAGESFSVPFISLPNTGDAADAFCVNGKNALFVIGDDGTVQWMNVALEGIVPRSDALIGGLRKIAIDSGASPQSRREFIAAAFAAAIVIATPVPTKSQETIPRILPAFPTPSSLSNIPGTLNWSAGV